MANGAPKPKAPPGGGVALGKTGSDAAREKQVREMMAEAERQKLIASLREPWKATIISKFASNVLGGPEGYKLLQLGLPDGTRLDLELEPGMAESVGVNLVNARLFTINSWFDSS